MALTQRKFSADSAASSTVDGSERILGLQGSPLTNRLFTIDQLHRLKSYTTSGVPSATGVAGRLIYVTDGDSGNPCLAVSNGSSWRKILIDGAL